MVRGLSKSWLVVELVFILCCVTEISQVQGRKRCPGHTNQCSLHGTCITKKGDYLCNCEWGYTSDDCSLKLCPMGYDPNTVNQQSDFRMKFMLRASTGEIGGDLLVSFQGHTVEMPAGGDILTTEACTRGFRRFQNLGDVTCERISTVGNNGATYEISVTKFPIYPIMNNLYHHDGNPAGSDFSCDTSKIVGAGDPFCIFENMVQQNYKVYVPCSNHGSCDSKTGICDCEDGYYGGNCGSNQDSKEYITGYADGPFFTGTVAKLKVKRSPSEEFMLLDANVAGHPIFTMDGTGHTILHRGDFVLGDGNQVIQKGGLSVHGDVRVSDSNLLIEGGSLDVQATKANTDGLRVSGSITPNSAHAVLSVFGVNTNQEVNSLSSLLKTTLNGETILEVSGDGQTFIHTGNLTMLKGGADIHGLVETHSGLAVSSGDIHVQAGRIDMKKGDLVLHDGSVHIQRVLTASSPALKVESKGGAALHVTSSGGDGNGSGGALLLLAEGGSGYHRPVFSVAQSGATTVHAGGLTVQAGGVRVEAGGQVIAAGGLVVKSGGIRVESGGLTLQNQGGFDIEDGGLRAANSVENGPSLHVKMLNKHFAGSGVLLESSSDAKGQAFKYISARTMEGEVWSIAADGTLKTGGDVVTSGHGRVISSGDLIAKRKAVFGYTTVDASDEIVIPSTHSYVKILDDHRKANNYANLDTSNASPGQLIFVQNLDAESTKGVSVPSNSTSTFVFDGENWQSVTASSFDAKKIHGIEEFTASSDLNIGDVKITARDLQAGSQKAQRVAYYGRGGLLSGDESFTYRDEKLTVPKLEVARLVGRVDLKGSELTDVTIISGAIRNVNISAEEIRTSGELHLGADAFIEGGLTVNGQVMGSGSYIDTSDKRFKKNIQRLTNVLSDIRSIKGVSFDFRASEFPKYKFSNKTQFGFVAQEIERRFPFLITEDTNGYKHMPYSSMIPLAIEGVKEVDKEVSRLTKVIEAQNSTLEKLKKDVQQSNQKSQEQSRQIKTLLLELETLKYQNALMVDTICQLDNVRASTMCTAQAMKTS